MTASTLSSLLMILALGCGSSSPPPPSAPGGGAAPPLQIPAEALPPRGTLMLGELHGTREIPAFVGRVVEAVSAREPVVLALEIHEEHGPSLQAFLASDGSAEARRRLLAELWWQVPFQDGRRSVAMLDLLEAVRALRAAGRRIEVVAIDHSGGDSEAREEAMARNVIAARRAHPEAALIVHAGNLHTSKREVKFLPGFAWMAMRVAAAGIPLVSLDARYADGTAWICRSAVAAECGAKFAAGRGPELGIQLEPSPDGQYDGWFGVGPVTASPPAGLPALAAQLDAQIAAALSSPLATRAKARRAYDAKDYARCADLLATVASPDASIAYDHACCLALAGRKDDALAKLQYAIAAGFQDLDHLEKDPDLASLRGDPRWPIKK